MTNAVRDPLSTARYDEAMARVDQLAAKIRDFERRHPKHAARARSIRFRGFMREVFLSFVMNGEATVVFSAGSFRVREVG